MKSLLFLTQRIPFPPNKGDKIRSFALLKHLSQSWRVYLGCFIDDPDDWRHVAALRDFCADICCVGLDRHHASIGALKALARGQSLTQGWFSHTRLRRWVAEADALHHPYAVVIFSSAMGQYLEQCHPQRALVDFVDVDSDKWEQYSRHHPWPLSWLYRREARRLLCNDQELAAMTDASLFVSEPEAELFRRLTPACAPKIHAVVNGIDLEFFSPGDYLNPYAAGEQPVVFTGAMDYRPNVDAVTWFATKILPIIRRSIPQATFTIAGANPNAQVRSLAEQQGIHVTGRVADMRPYLAHAAVAVAPLRMARGVQNKVLEAMAMGRIVVTTPQGLEGIDALPGRDLLVADSTEAFAQTVIAALSHSFPAMGQAARARMEQGYNWEDKFTLLDKLLEQ